ncbi:DUF6809 family protein [Acetivibrio sp. MSJd-27]|uniref:DUF6809 family protein n=1 Tax=Acetivibrio sp. MSJd-27 TaxID=2841523 RepID=UPI001C0FBDAE|nr:DUF6809 family protein [Acetivibrio sp. MSJd-27]MBU5450092.1 hypothetical protein [Acetivibrio sp. MSJd-27]
MDILKKLFLGEISPIEQLRPQTTEYDGYAQKYFQYEKQFYSRLDEESKKQFQELFELESQMELEEFSLCFCRGFKLGIQLMLAAMET